MTTAADIDGSIKRKGIIISIKKLGDLKLAMQMHKERQCNHNCFKCQRHQHKVITTMVIMPLDDRAYRVRSALTS